MYLNEVTKNAKNTTGYKVNANSFGLGSIDQVITGKDCYWLKEQNCMEGDGSFEGTWNGM